MNCLNCGNIIRTSPDDGSKFCGKHCENTFAEGEERILSRKSGYTHKCLHCKGQIESFNNVSGFCNHYCQMLYEYEREPKEIPKRGFFEQLKDIVKNFRL